MCILPSKTETASWPIPGTTAIPSSRELVRSLVLAGLLLGLLVTSARSVVALDYGSVEIGTSKTLTTGAVCPAPPGSFCLTIGSAVIRGSNADEFIITNQNCVGVTLPGGSGCSIDVTFIPKTPTGLKAASLDVLSTDGAVFFSIPLVGVAEELSSKRFSEEQKQELRQLAREEAKKAAIAGALERLCPNTPCKVIAKTFANLFAFQARQALLLSLDPPDPNYTIIIQPIHPSLPQVTFEPGTPQAVTESFNRLLFNYEQAIGLAGAIIVSINRADGALQAGDSKWEAWQLQAAGQYAKQWAALLNERAFLLTSFSSALEASGLIPVIVTPEDIKEFQNGISTNGLPDFLVEGLSQLGLDNDTFNDIRSLMIEVDSNDAAGRFNDALAQESFFDSLRRTATAMNNFALQHIRDVNGPKIIDAAVSPSLLWPPNHMLIDVFVSYNLEEESQVHEVTLNVTSNEPENGLGDGNMVPDWEIVDTHHVRLRAERAGRGVGRIYTITIAATDIFGNLTAQSVMVTVPANLNP